MNDGILVMTKEQLAGFINDAVRRAIEENTDALLEKIKTKVAEDIKLPERRLEYGIPGIERIFSCGRTTAFKIKNSGVIDEAISQVGRKIVIDADLALKLYQDGKRNILR